MLARERHETKCMTSNLSETAEKSSAIEETIRAKFRRAEFDRAMERLESIAWTLEDDGKDDLVADVRNVINDVVAIFDRTDSLS